MVSSRAPLSSVRTNHIAQSLGSSKLGRPKARTFLSSSSQTLHATRRLPYSRKALFDFIADIRSYPHFLPYCLNAKILEWSEADSQGKRWPASAELTVGWGSIQEQYISQVNCVPGRIVESLAGDAPSLLSEEDRKIYHGLSQRRRSTNGEVFKSLRSTWTLQDTTGASGPESTEVELEIAFDFQNPFYAALAGAAVPKVAGTVMDAFEKRARQVLVSTD